MSTAERCEHHDFAATVEVSRLHERDGDDSPNAFTAQVRVECADCGAPFGFKGPPGGFSFAEPRCSIDALMIELPLMSPTELELAGPLPAARRGPMVYEAGPASSEGSDDER